MLIFYDVTNGTSIYVHIACIYLVFSCLCYFIISIELSTILTVAVHEQVITILACQVTTQCFTICIIWCADQNEFLHVGNFSACTKTQ